MDYSASTASTSIQQIHLLQVPATLSESTASSPLCKYTSFERVGDTQGVSNFKNCYSCKFLRQQQEETDKLMTNLRDKFSTAVRDVIETSEQLLHMNSVCEDLQEENKMLLQKYNDSCRENQNLRDNLLKFFTTDQLSRLNDGVTRGRKYEEDTITLSISLWFACGSVGYTHLVHKGLPLPSISTLQKRLATVIFTPGRQLHMNELLSRKVLVLLFLLLVSK
jgi:hypothetical protein